jgi:hypothetical protein
MVRLSCGWRCRQDSRPLPVIGRFRRERNERWYYTPLQPPVVTRREAREWGDVTSEPAVATCLVAGRPVILGLGVRAAV